MNERLKPFFEYEIRFLLRSVIDVRLVILLGLYLLFGLGAAQIPLTYRVNIGQPDGVGSDLPLIEGFYAAADSPSGRFRWSGAQSLVQLPGFGRRPLPAQLRILPVSADTLQAVVSAELWSGGQLVAPLRLRLGGAIYHVLLPADRDHQIIIRSPTFRAAGDARELGVPVGALSVRRLGFAWPGIRMDTLIWLAALIMLWAGVRRAGWAVGGSTTIVLIVIATLGVCSVWDPPRTALGAAPFTLALAFAWLLVLFLRHTLPVGLKKIAVPVDQAALAWLLLLVLVVFVLRYGGKLYPGSMPGDISFHANRLTELLGGRILLQAPHRGVVAPYPPALYLMLAPFTLGGVAPRQLLHFAAALIDACSPCVVYAIGRLAVHRSMSHRMALVAAGFYALAPAGMLVSWWNFSTYGFAQAAQLALVVAVLVGLRPRIQARAPIGRPPGSVLAVLAVLSLLVYLGHFSYYLNTSLLLGGATLLLIASSIGGQIDRLTAFRIVCAAIVAQAVAIGVFFSFYMPALQGQADAVESGAAVALIADPLALAGFIESILGEGLRDHMGLFPVLLALCGIAWYGLGWKRLTPLGAVLTCGTLLIAAGFGVLPLFSAANLTTRWLTFALWAVALTAAPVGMRLWNSGRVGRIVSAIIGMYLGWISAAIWLAALAWRIRPPEPF